VLTLAHDEGDLERFAQAVASFVDRHEALLRAR